MTEETPLPQDRNIVPVELEKQMKESYIDYAMSVIVGRALPDARDGLKPVQRRILYTMHDMNLQPDRAHSKSSKVVGNVMGRFHPHGDSAIYDTMVRMAQDFNSRHPLVGGQGNFGTVDGDNAAAMRYTEARLTRFAQTMLADIDQETVDFVENYDGTEQEPLTLPGAAPNLLVNGGAGIAVGMATNIPPHNLAETIDAAVALIDDPGAGVLELMRHVKGPDFPTGASILGRSGIRDLYETGRGKVVMRGIAHVEEMKGDRHRIVITEIPFQVNKASLVESVADLVKDKRIEGISDIRDETSREGTRVAIDLKRDANPHVVLNYLYKHTSLQTNFGGIMLALVDGRPQVLNLKQALEIFIEHRRTVVRRRLEYELKKARERAHILEGIRIALENLDETIALIRASKDGATAQAALIERFELTEIQAKAILDLRLQKLTSLEQDGILQEHAALLVRIEEIEGILADESRVFQIIKSELLTLKEKHADPRRTVISDDEADIDIEDLIKREDVVITITRDGWIKRLPVDTFRQQGRGGRGVKGLTKKEEDIVRHMFVTSSHDEILFFSARGQIYRLKAYRIPPASRTAKGIPAVNLLQLKADEKITAIVPVESFVGGGFLVMATKNGVVKKTSLAEYDTQRKGGIIGINLREDDELRYVIRTNGERDLVLATRKGLSIRFSERNVRPMGRSATGVRGIQLNDGDELVGADIVNDERSLLVVCQNGFGKRTPLKYYRKQNRGGKGIITIRATERNGDVVGISVVDESLELMMITAKGVMIRQPVNQISLTIGRGTQGVRLMRVDDGDSIVAFEVFEPTNGSDGEEEAGQNEETQAEESNEN